MTDAARASLPPDQRERWLESRVAKFRSFVEHLGAVTVLTRIRATTSAARTRAARSGSSTGDTPSRDRPTAEG